MPRAGSVSLVVRRRRDERAFGFEFCQERLQSSAVELPLKRTRRSIAQFLVQPQSLLDFLQAGEVVRGQHLSLDDREVDLHLIEPTGMHGRMDQDRLAVRLPQSPYRRLTAVRGAVVYDPKDTAGRPVGLGPHDLLNHAAKRVDPGFLLAPTHDSTTTNVPSSQVLQGSPSLVLMLHAHRTTRRGRKRRVTSDARLNARLLIRADDVVSAAQRFALPGASVQVQDAPSFFGELRVAGEDPVLIPPWLDRVRVEDTPDSAVADWS